MRDLETITPHPLSEQLVDVLCKKTQNADPMFFRILVSYYFAKLASMMRVDIATRDRDIIPVNLYAINLATSGQGKGHSTNIIEEQLLAKFKTLFFEETYPLVVEESLAKIAVKRAAIKDEDPEVMQTIVTKEFENLGHLAFSFDSGTTAAVKQMRHKLLMAEIGSMNLEIDEIGSNLLGNAEVLTTFLELFDIGKIKQKLTKNTRENTRNEEIDGRTPTNLLLFGTPSKLLNGGKTEEEFYSFLEIGYARRCLFGYTKQTVKKKLSAEEVYATLTSMDINAFLKETAEKFSLLANIINYRKRLTVSKEVSIQLIEYRLHCEEIADQYGEHEEIRKAELSHRYFKALKLAGAYAFIDGEYEITEDNLYAAIYMTELSGQAFSKLLSRDRNYVKLAKYIAAVGKEITHVELTEDLPFFKGSIAAKQDLLQLATAWGYKHQVIIKRHLLNNIEFICGETLQATDLDRLTLAYSADIADGYKNVLVSWDNLCKLTQQPDLHWINHHSESGHRDDTNMLEGFDLVVIDVDSGTTTVNDVKILFKDYKYLLHTTKRFDPAHHRFRLVFPLNYHLKLSSDDYKEFMRNIYEWLPFPVDTQTVDRCRKWLTHPGKYLYGKGENTLDTLLFIPKTAKNDERKSIVQNYQNLSNLERWFIQTATQSGRNNQLLKYALVLMDMGYNLKQIQAKVYQMNDCLEPKLSKAEIKATILTTIQRKIVP